MQAHDAPGVDAGGAAVGVVEVDPAQVVAELVDPDAEGGLGHGPVALHLATGEEASVGLVVAQHEAVRGQRPVQRASMGPDRVPGAALGGLGAGHDDAKVELVRGQPVVAVAAVDLEVMGREVDRGVRRREDLAGDGVVAGEVAAAVGVVPRQGDHHDAVVDGALGLGRGLEVELTERRVVVVVGHALVRAEEQLAPVRGGRAQRGVLELRQDDQHVLGPDGRRGALAGLGRARCARTRRRPGPPRPGGAGPAPRPTEADRRPRAGARTAAADRRVWARRTTRCRPCPARPCSRRGSRSR